MKRTSVRAALPCIAMALLTVTSRTALAQTVENQQHPPIDSLLAVSYEHKMISSGDNFPTINLRKQHRTDILVLLANYVNPETIGTYFGWTKAELDARLKELVDAGLVKRDPNLGYVPTIMVMTESKVAQHMPVAGSLVDEVVKLLTKATPEIQDRYEAIDTFSDVPFDSSSLLILSDVLLDNWQINAVEEQFLGAKRPLRDGRRYYYSLQEKPPLLATEAFGIYGNSYRGYDGVTVGIYGNRRNANPLNFDSMDRDQIEDLFGVRPDTLRNFKVKLLKIVVAAVQNGTTVPADYRDGLRRMGWMDDARILIPILNSEDNLALKSMAGTITDELVVLLDNNRDDLMGYYLSSPYGSQVTFDEYFMWWYHLFYTRVTDQLGASGRLVIPARGITSFLLVD